MIFISIFAYYALVFGLPTLAVVFIFRRKLTKTAVSVGRYFVNWHEQDQRQERLAAELKRRDEEKQRNGAERAEAELEEGTGGALSRVSDFTEGKLPQSPPREESQDSPKQQEERH